jgi:hypothetical protein
MKSFAPRSAFRRPYSRCARYPGLSKLAQKRRDTGPEAGAVLTPTIFDKIRRGERDTGQDSAPGRVTQFEKTHPFRDLRQIPIWAPPGGSRSLLAYHNGFAFFDIYRIM